MNYRGYEFTAKQRIMAWQVSRMLGFEDEETAADCAMLFVVDYDTNTAYPQVIGKHFDSPGLSTTEPMPWTKTIDSILALRIVKDGEDEIRAFWSEETARSEFASGQHFDALDYQSSLEGARKWTRTVKYLFRDPHNDHLMCYCWIIEIDSFRKNQARTVYLAEHDSLTGLYNRHKLANASLGEGAYIVLDVNDFEWLCDSYGHNVGDKALMVLAGRLVEVFNSACESKVFRLGDNEFLAFMKHATEEQVVACLEQLAEPLWVGSEAEKRFEFTVSAGYAMGSDSASAIDAAEKALHEVKRLDDSCRYLRG